MIAKASGKHKRDSVLGAQPLPDLRASGKPSVNDQYGSDVDESARAMSQKGRLAPMVIAITSADGGVGRTTITANLALALGERGRRVLVLDADFVHPRVDTRLGLKPHGDTGDLLAGRQSIEEIIVAGPPGVHLIPGSADLDALGDLDVAAQVALIWAIDVIAQPVDILLIDTAAGLRPEVATFARAAHHVIVLARGEPDSTDSAGEFIAGLSCRFGVDHFKLVACQTPHLSAGAALFRKLRRACERLSDVTIEYAGTVPSDACLQRGIGEKCSIHEAEPSSRSARAIRALAARVDGWARPAGTRGQLEFFVERLVDAHSQRSGFVLAVGHPSGNTPAVPSSDAAYWMPEALIDEHRRLVVGIAYTIVRHLPNHVEVDDLVQVGMMSLLDAAQRYAPDKGATFETYAGIRIRGAMVDHLRHTDWSPRSLHRRVREIEGAKQRMESVAGRIARPADVAAAVGISIDAYHRTLRDSAMSHLLSSSALDSGSGGSVDYQTAHAAASTADELEHEQLRLALGAAIDALPDTDRMVVSLCYGDGLLLREIGVRLKVSESRVSQLRNRALKRLRASVRPWLQGGTDARERTKDRSAGTPWRT
jgi:FliA/WhiG family RNA polymerase sigma factor